MYFIQYLNTVHERTTFKLFRKKRVTVQNKKKKDIIYMCVIVVCFFVISAVRTEPKN
jgi:hypothetical protein